MYAAMCGRPKKRRQHCHGYSALSCAVNRARPSFLNSILIFSKISCALFSAAFPHHPEFVEQRIDCLISKFTPENQSETGLFWN